MTGLKTRIQTHRFSESLAFYTDHLGMTVLQSWGDAGKEGAILGLGDSADGEAFLELAVSEVPPSYAGLSLQFRVPDLASLAERLEGAWVFRGPVARPWGSTYLYLEDPTGIQVIVYEGDL